LDLGPGEVDMVDLARLVELLGIETPFELRILLRNRCTCHERADSKDRQDMSHELLRR
jgi:hypothetical protein